MIPLKCRNSVPFPPLLGPRNTTFLPSQGPCRHCPGRGPVGVGELSPSVRMMGSGTMVHNLRRVPKGLTIRWRLIENRTRNTEMAAIPT